MKCGICLPDKPCNFENCPDDHEAGWAEKLRERDERYSRIMADGVAMIHMLKAENESLKANLNDAIVDVEVWKGRAAINGRKGFEYQDERDRLRAQLAAADELLAALEMHDWPDYRISERVLTAWVAYKKSKGLAA